MLPPHELKNKTFSRAMRGYNPVEVDEYVEFVIGKYTELYRENDELQRKLKSAVTKLDEIKGEEDSIRGALIDAKRAASKIKSDAEDRAEAIIRSAKASCNTILADFNEKIEAGRDTLTTLQADALALKQELFERYSEHIKYIDSLTEGIDESAIPDTDSLRREAVASLKQSIADAYADGRAAADRADDETDLENDAPESEVDEAPDVPMTDDEPESADETITFTPALELDPEPEETNDNSLTVTFDKLSDKSDDIDPSLLTIEREPLNRPTKKNSLTGSIKELNKRYKDEDVINTPDSDLDDDANYLDFVKSVTGKDKTDDKKQADFDLLFDNKK